MFIGGLALLIIGLLLGWGILVTIGVILMIAGVVLWIVGASHPVGGRRHYY
jgi:hypothetical protein